MTSHLSRAARVETFRSLHRREGGFLIPNAWDVGGARFAERARLRGDRHDQRRPGVEPGPPDGGAGREAALANARAIAAAIPVPVSADLENGFGPSAEAVVETVRQAADAGLAGLSIEDASGEAQAPIYDFAHAVERIAAAAEANRALATPLVLTARAENFLHGRPDLDDTIRRLTAFAQAGADVLYAPGLPDLAAVRAVCSAVGSPVNVLAGGGSPPWSAAEIFAAGAQRISVGSSLARVALGGLLDAARAMRETGDFTWADRQPRFGDLNSALTHSGDQ